MIQSKYYIQNFTLFKFILNRFCFRLLHLVEAGIIKYMSSEGLPKAEICPQDLNLSDRQLHLGDLMMTYMVMVAGYIAGLVIFSTEV